MKVLNLSWDSSALDRSSEFVNRAAGFSALCQRYAVIVPAKEDVEVNLSESLVAYGVAGGEKNGFFPRLAVLLKIYKLARRLVSQEGYEVITTQDPFELAFLGWLLKRKHGTALNIQEHGDFFSARFWRREKKLNFFKYHLGRFLIKKADSVRAVSQRIKKTLVEKLGINENKITVVPIYTDVHEQEKFAALAELAKRYKDKFVFFTAGRLVKQKNLPLAIRAFGTVARNIPNSVFIIAGRGPEKDKLAKIAAKFKLEGRVEFYDWLNDIYEWYKAADAFVLSSNYEGWGRTVIEAASCGLPIIMTDVGCANEVIRDRESGLVVPIGDEKRLAEAMFLLIKDGGLARTIGDGARQAVFNLPGREEMLALYKKSWQTARHYSGSKTASA